MEDLKIIKKNLKLIDKDFKERIQWAEVMGNLYPNAQINKAVRKITLTDGLHKLEISQNPNFSKLINLSYSYKERKGTRIISIQDSCSINKNKLYYPLEIFKYFDKFKS